MTQIAAALFDWDAVEARSDLERFFLVRDHLPDRDLSAWTANAKPNATQQGK